MNIKQLFPLALISIFLSCNSNSGNPSKEQVVESIQKKEFEKNEELYKNAGKLVGEFDFSLIAT